MLPENEHFIREFEKIVNKVYNKYIEPKKRKTIINYGFWIWCLINIEMN